MNFTKIKNVTKFYTMGLYDGEGIYQLHGRDIKKLTYS